MIASLPMAELLVGVGLATPALAVLACFSQPIRERLWVLLALIPLPALAAAIVAMLVLGQGEVAQGDVAAISLLFDPTGLAIGLVVDRPGAALLGVAALLWAAGGLYAAPMLQASPHRGRFTLFWLLTLTGSLGVFIAADLVSFYLFYGLVSLAAFGLIAHDGTAFARRATGLYLLLAILGEIALLLAFALLSAASSEPSLAITSLVAGLSGSPWSGLSMALLLLGFALKIALVPGHVWMPLAYTAAPFPAAAVLSGAAVKAGVIGLIRFLPFEAGAPAWGELLIVLGWISAFYGVAIGITQRNAKTVLAYSSISQMGLIAAATGLALRAGESAVVLLLTLYAAHHLLAKGALFLGLGLIAEGVTRRRWLVLLPAALVGLGIAGLPLTGGAAAKLALKPLFDSPALGLLAALSAAGSTLLMLHFLRRLWCSGEGAVAAVSGAGGRSSAVSEPGPSAVKPSLTLGGKTGAAMEGETDAGSVGAIDPHAIQGPCSGLFRRLLPWWLMALAALLLPWLLLPWLGIGPTQTWLVLSISPADLWKASWPLLLGALAALALWRWGERLPPVPPGDILVWWAPLVRLISAIGAGVERLDRGLRQWPVAGLSLLILSLLLWVGVLNVH
ncbi:MAG: proton-conducting transporter membrane subunit [Lamprobacter sp.]|uniref:complex I subunit 5 family protein n=1 Tax=Lamprobacter sp. TaxID=3100796 RepID=UPI002B25720A|nr:proton-conducting transporter membrane subunit [Lamprobacter sp.]MEA3639709.1 proton-conducting transporter membrane subunit [Lamprobacter sp.]